MISLVLLPFLFGPFIQKWYFPKGGEFGVERICISDTDRDGHYEFFVSGYSIDTFNIFVYESHLPNSWEIDSFPSLLGSLVWAVGDFDLDGLSDLIVHGAASCAPVIPIVSVFESPDSFSYPTQEAWCDTTTACDNNPYSVFDVDNDGTPEILDNKCDSQPYHFCIRESIGNNQYETVYATNPDTNFSDLPYSTHACGDFDGDGKIEFVMGGSNCWTNYWIYESPANNTYEKVWEGDLPIGNIRDCFSVPDADGDDKMEFVVKGFHPLGGYIRAFIFEATGNNTYEIIKTFDFYSIGHPDYSCGYSEAGDVDGDSIPEIVLEASNVIAVIKAASNDSFYVWETLPGNAKGSSVRSTNDIDGNGLNEIVISGNNQTRIYEYSPEGVEEVNCKMQGIGVEIHPNPFSQYLCIQLGTNKGNNAGHGLSLASIELRIYDITGRMVKDCTSLLNYRSFNNQITWDGSDDKGCALPQGVYFIHLTTNDNSVIIRKVIKLK